MKLRLMSKVISWFSVNQNLAVTDKPKMYPVVVESFLQNNVGDRPVAFALRLFTSSLSLLVEEKGTYV